MNLKQAQILMINGAKVTCKDFMTKGNYVHFVDGVFMFHYKSTGDTDIGSTFNAAEEKSWEIFEEEEKCKYKMTNEEKRPEFERVVKPVIEFINNYYHPHVKIIIDCGSAEIVEGEMTMKTEEFWND